MLDYIGRLKELRACIIEGDQNLLNRTLTSVETSSIDSFALESFFEGLPPEYYSEICTERYTNLQEAYSKAILISERLERDEVRLRSYRSNNNNNNNRIRNNGEPTDPDRQTLET